MTKRILVGALLALAVAGCEFASDTMLDRNSRSDCAVCVVGAVV